MTTSPTGARTRAPIEARFAIRDLSHKFAVNKRTAEDNLLRAALFEAYQLGFEAGFNAQEETANGFPQA